MKSRNGRITRLFVWAGGVTGLAAGLVLSAFRFGWIRPQPGVPGEPAPPSGVEILDGLAFLLVLTIPFALCLFSLRFKKSAPQAGIWLGSSLLALLGSRATFSFVSLITMPISAALLVVAGLLALRRGGRSGLIPALGLAAALVVIGAASFFALFAQENQACWALVENTAGEQTWEPRPPGDSATLPDDPQPGEPIAWSCSSDVVTTAESLGSLALWALALLGLAGVLPQWKLQDA